MASWSFVLAARMRGLRTGWTTLHLLFEQDAAELPGIPFDDLMPGALMPVACTKGSTFKPAFRKP